ncbi:hypothetical protein [Haloprofundus salilacus]|uniref:hypothetical protein n=1 Tax=Haloprofundus salilacus TaxID=2876190 RepID=UPI003CCCED37
MAGLLTARVLADRYREVTVIERDPTPVEPLARRGVPRTDTFICCSRRGVQPSRISFPDSVKRSPGEAG